MIQNIIVIAICGVAIWFCIRHFLRSMKNKSKCSSCGCCSKCDKP